MQFWIEQVILWPKDKTKSKQVIRFENNKVNIVYGDSRTGKSALIPIVDYCFCSGDCRIPVDTIRNATSWFGVLFKLGNQEILLCRKEPGARRSSGEMYYQLDTNITVPDTIEKDNTHVDDMKDELNRLFDITDVKINDDDFSSIPRPSFRDAAAFLYQPQNIIANPEALFYKLEEAQHQRKLSSIFPYLLGAETEDELIKKHQVEALENEIRKKERELQRSQDVSDRWVKELEAQITKAAELGLTDRPRCRDYSFQENLHEVERIISRDYNETPTSAASIENTALRIAELRSEESKLSSEISSLEWRQTRIDEAISAYNDYQNTKLSASDYLGATDWLLAQAKSEQPCPVCGGNLSDASHTLNKLVHARRELMNDNPCDSLIGSLGAERINLAAQIREIVEKKNAISNSLRILESAKVKNKFSNEGVQRFLGQLESSYNHYRALGEDKGLVKELKKLKSEREELWRGLDRDKRNRIITEALSDISGNAEQIITNLDVEHPTWDISFDYKNLALKIRDGYGQDRYLSQIGSASNWLSYHIALELGLQQFFQTDKPVNIPSFLICDQPSQVYFPHGEIDVARGERQDRDKEAVRKIFKSFDMFLKKGFSFQIIVTEHAGEDIWGAIDNKYVAAHWTVDGEKLIPNEWLESEE